MDARSGDSRSVLTDPGALYYNIVLNDRSLTPGDNPILGPTHFKDWLAGLTKQRSSVQVDSTAARPLGRLGCKRGLKSTERAQEGAS